VFAVFGQKDFIVIILVHTAKTQNKDIQKVDSSNRYHVMIHHQNADAMGLARVQAHQGKIVGLQGRLGIL
jgi:hypothetical protein